MRYEILGPLRVLDGTDHSFISARKIETVLSLLLIRADAVVLPSQIITEIWGEDPPRSASAGVHVYISQLRKFLHRDAQGVSSDRILTRAPGYVLRQGEDEIDFQLFLREVGLGRDQVRDQRLEQAADSFERALAMWRGPVMGDIRGTTIDGFATWLEEVRMECLELLTEVQLKRGRHRELIGQLYSLTIEHPLRETLYRHLMLALYRCERQADALRVYQNARNLLTTELGLEPCRSLRELHQAILADDDRLELRAVS